MTTLHDKTKDITRGALKPRRLLGCGSPAAREERGFHRAHFGPAGDKCGPCELGCAEQNKYNALHTARAAARITSGTPSRPIARKEITQGYHLRHCDRLGSRACADWLPGVGPSRCPAASMEGGPPAPFKKAGRAAGAIPLILLASVPCLHVRLSVSRIGPKLLSLLINKIQQGNKP